MGKETLDKLAENYLLSSVERNQYGDELSFIDGYKLAQEKSYSEEEVLAFYEWFAFEVANYGYPTNENILKALKQFKKK